MTPSMFQFYPVCFRYIFELQHKSRVERRHQKEKEMITILGRSKRNVFGFEASGEISESDIQGVAAQLDEAIKAHGKISWLFVMKTAKYTSLRAMYEDMMWLLKNIKHFDRMAIVGDKKWEKLLIKADGLVFGEKYFDISQLDDAWKYVEGDPKQ
ncbi:MAG TPA: STAS/SEC14 domain-containing protein [Desulfobacterales bacterium]|nr:STAS/SEC14 domain-containing protein [Desulfobacterales bacterium]